MAIPVQATPRTVTLTIDGRRSPSPRARRSGPRPRRPGSTSRCCATTSATTRSASAGCAWSTSARPPSPPPACAPCEDGMEVKTATPEVERSRAVLTELLLADQPERERDPKQTTTGDNELLALADRYGVSREDGLPLGRRPRHGPLQPGHRGGPRLVHPVRPLRARLRRHPGQRRHRPQRQGLRHPDRVRPERPDGRVLVRDLRGVRRGLPDRRADQQADPRASRSGRAASSTRSTRCARTAASAAR